MVIIQIKAMEGDFHPFQSQSHRTECWLEGWIEVPTMFTQMLQDCGGYCELVIEGDTLANVIPIERPTPEPTPDPVTNLALLTVDHEFRLLLLELGI